MALFGFAHRSNLLIATQDSRLALIHGQPYLFLSGRQFLCGIDPAAADLWRQYRRGRIEDSRTARQGATADLLAVGAIEPLSCEEGAVDVAATVTLGIGARTVLLTFSDTALRSEVMPAFEHMRVPDRVSDEQIAVFREGRKVGVARRNGPVDRGPADQSAPLVKLALTEIALDGVEGLAIHAAGAIRDSRALLLLGAPGAGKSTLSLRLDGAGFALAADDLIDLTSDGLAQMLPFPATSKDGAWPLLERHRPEIARCQTFRRPDDKIVRYLPVDETLSDRPCPIGWIVVLDRRERAAPAVTPLNVADAFAALLDSAWSGSSELDPQGFHSLAAAIDGAVCMRLTYSDLGTAAGRLDEVCGTDPSQGLGPHEKGPT